MKFYPIIKRYLDLIASVFIITILTPLLLVTALVIKIDSKGPVFFKQKRIGRNKKEFYMVKFRTMKKETPKDVPTHMLQNPHIYITKIGKFLRKSSLDEIPQIINIIKGDMSFIGPRPALWNQYDLIMKRDQNDANNIYPGLTGWAQINGRDELCIDDKAAFDGEYVKNMSFTFDIIILLNTIFSVLRSKGFKEGVITIDKEKISL